MQPFIAQVAAFRGAALWRKGGDCGAAATCAHVRPNSPILSIFLDPIPIARAQQVARGGWRAVQIRSVSRIRYRAELAGGQSTSK